MKKQIVLVFLFFLNFIFAQQKQIDSLLRISATTKDDSLKLCLIVKICDSCVVNDNLKYGSLGISTIQQLKSKGKNNLSANFILKKEAYFTKIIRVYYESKDDYQNIKKCDEKLIAIYEKLGDKDEVENTYFEMADILLEQKNIQDAFKMIGERLMTNEKINNLSLIAKIQNKLGWMYDRINYTSKMVDYMEKSLNSNIKLNDTKGIASAYSNLAVAYRYNNDPKRALECNLKSLEYFEKEKDDRKIFRALYEASQIYSSLNNPKKALELSNRCMNIATKLNDTSMFEYVNFVNVGIYTQLNEHNNAEKCGLWLYHYAVSKKNEFNIMNASISLGKAYLNLNKPKMVIKYLAISDSIAKNKNDLYALKNSLGIKYLLYKNLGDYKNALEIFLESEKVNDSISSIENHKGLEQQELIAEFEKIESKSREEQQIKDNRIREEKKIQNLIIVFVACGFLLVAVLLVIVFRNYRNKQRSNLELAQKNELISTQKKVVEEKQKEMLDSITYAKRLQSAILPPDNFIMPHFDDFFIFYKPKDIVAGDFYWAEQSDNLVFIAAADSTGHGVPGAMVSVVCSNALNRTIKEFKLSETGKILDRARDLVIETFEKSNSDVKDGMDISLLCVDNLNNKIFWSGANNPLWYFQNGKLNEITADKQPIGKTENKKPFSTHEIAYQKGSIFYLFTDGYADQFGGPKGKKFKYKQLQDLLLRNIQFAMAKQQSELDSEFVGWKGELEQIDDVCVIGLKI